MKQTNWQEQLVKQFANRTISFATLDDTEELKQFISNLIEQVIEDIPDDNCDIDYDCEGICNTELKDQLKSKYL